MNMAMYSAQIKLEKAIVFDAAASSSPPTYYDDNGVAHVMTTNPSTAPVQVTCSVKGNPSTTFFAPGSKVEHVIDPPADCMLDVLHVHMRDVALNLPRPDVVCAIEFVLAGFSEAGMFDRQAFVEKLGSFVHVPLDHINIETISHRPGGRLIVSLVVHEGSNPGVVQMAFDGLTMLDLTSRLGVLVVSAQVRVPMPRLNSSVAPIPHWSFDTLDWTKSTHARSINTRTIVRSVQSDDAPVTSLVLTGITLESGRAALISMLGNWCTSATVSLYASENQGLQAIGSDRRLTLHPSIVTSVEMTPTFSECTLEIRFSEEGKHAVHVTIVQEVLPDTLVAQQALHARKSVEMPTFEGFIDSLTGSLGHESNVRLELVDGHALQQKSGLTKHEIDPRKPARADGVAPSQTVLRPGDAEYIVEYASFMGGLASNGSLGVLPSSFGSRGASIAAALPVDAPASAHVPAGWPRSTPYASAPRLVLSENGEDLVVRTDDDSRRITVVTNQLTSESPLGAHFSTTLSNSRGRLPEGRAEVYVVTEPETKTGIGYAIHRDVASGAACVMGPLSHPVVHDVAYDEIDHVLHVLFEPPYHADRFVKAVRFIGDDWTVFEVLPVVNAPQMCFWEYGFDGEIDAAFTQLPVPAVLETYADRQRVGPSEWLRGTSSAPIAFFEPTTISIPMRDRVRSGKSAKLVFRMRDRHTNAIISPPYPVHINLRSYVDSSHVLRASKTTRFSSVTPIYDLGNESNVDMQVVSQTLEPEPLAFAITSQKRPLLIDGPWGQANVLVHARTTLHVPFVTRGPVSTIWTDARTERPRLSSRVVLQGGNTVLDTCMADGQVTIHNWSQSDDAAAPASMVYSQASHARAAAPAAPLTHIRLRLVAGYADSTANVRFAGGQPAMLSHSSQDATLDEESGGPWALPNVHLHMDMDTGVPLQPFQVEGRVGNAWVNLASDVYVNGDGLRNVQLARTRVHVSDSGVVSFESAKGYPFVRAGKMWPVYAHESAAQHASSRGVAVKVGPGLYVPAAEEIDTAMGIQPHALPQYDGRALHVPTEGDAYDFGISLNGVVKARVSAVPSSNGKLVASMLGVNEQPPAGAFGKFWRARCISQTASIDAISVGIRAGQIVKPSTQSSSGRAVTIDLGARHEVFHATVHFGPTHALATTDALPSIAENAVSIEASDDGMAWHALGVATPTRPCVLLGWPHAYRHRDDMYSLPSMDAFAPYEATVSIANVSVERQHGAIEVAAGSVLRIAAAPLDDWMGAWSAFDIHGNVVAQAMSPFEDIEFTSNASIGRVDVSLLEQPYPADSFMLQFSPSASAPFVDIAKGLLEAIPAPLVGNVLPETTTLSVLSTRPSAADRYWLTTRSSVDVRCSMVRMSLLEPPPKGSNVVVVHSDLAAPAQELPYVFLGEQSLLDFEHAVNPPAHLRVYKNTSQIHMEPNAHASFELHGLCAQGIYTFDVRVETGNLEICVPGSAWEPSLAPPERIHVLSADTSVAYRSITLGASHEATTISFEAPVGGLSPVHFKSSSTRVDAYVGNVRGPGHAAHLLRVPSGACTISQLAGASIVPGMSVQISPWVNTLASCCSSKEEPWTTIEAIQRFTLNDPLPYTRSVHTGGSVQPEGTGESLEDAIEAMLALGKASVMHDRVHGVRSIPKSSAFAGPFRLAGLTSSGAFQLDDANQVLLMSALGTFDASELFPDARIDVEIVYEDRSPRMSSALLLHGSLGKVELGGEMLAVARVGDEIRMLRTHAVVEQVAIDQIGQVSLYKPSQSVRFSAGCRATALGQVFMRDNTSVQIDMFFEKGEQFELSLTCMGFGAPLHAKSAAVVHRGDVVFLRVPNNWKTPRTEPSQCVVLERHSDEFYVLLPDAHSPSTIVVRFDDDKHMCRFRVLPAGAVTRHVVVDVRSDGSTRQEAPHQTGEAHITVATRDGYLDPSTLSTVGDEVRFSFTGDGLAWPLWLRCEARRSPKKALIIENAVGTTFKLADDDSNAIIVAPGTPSRIETPLDLTGAYVEDSANTVLLIEDYSNELQPFSHDSGILLAMRVRKAHASMCTTHGKASTLVCESDRSTGDAPYMVLTSSGMHACDVRIDTMAPSGIPRARRWAPAPSDVAGACS